MAKMWTACPISSAAKDCSQGRTASTDGSCWLSPFLGHLSSTPETVGYMKALRVIEGASKGRKRMEGKAREEHRLIRQCKLWESKANEGQDWQGNERLVRNGKKM